MKAWGAGERGDMKAWGAGVAILVILTLAAMRAGGAQLWFGPPHAHWYPSPVNSDEQLLVCDSTNRVIATAVLSYGSYEAVRDGVDEVVTGRYLTLDQAMLHAEPGYCRFWGER